jgi:hypothetical protein
MYSIGRCVARTLVVESAIIISYIIIHCIYQKSQTVNMSEFQTHQQLIIRFTPSLADRVGRYLSRKNAEALNIEVLPEGK